MAWIGSALGTAAGAAGLAAFGLGTAAEYNRPFKRLRFSSSTDAGPSTPRYMPAGAGPAGQLVNRRIRYGRRKSRTRALAKTIYRDPYYYQTYFGCLSDYASRTTNTTAPAPRSGRSYFLYNWYNRGIDQGLTGVFAQTNPAGDYFPVHLYCLTQKDGVVSGSKHATAHEMYVETAAPNNVKFNELYGSQRTGGTATTLYYQCWRTNAYEGALTNAQKSVLRFVNIQALLQGTVDTPTTFCFQLVQFLDENLSPNAEASSDRTKFFMNMATKLVNSPLNGNPADVQPQGRMKVLHRKFFRVLPDTTTNKDAVAGQYRVNYRVNLNRLCRWNWKYGSYSEARADWKDANRIVTEQSMLPSSNLSNYLEPIQARMYLMITARGWEGYDGNTPVVNPITGNVPSYDLRIINEHVLPISP